MVWKCVSLVLSLVVGVLVVMIVSMCCRGKDVYDAGDVHQAHRALAVLNEAKKNGDEPPEMDERELSRLNEHVQMVGLKMDKEEGKEGYDTMKFPRYPPATLKSLYESGVPINKTFTSWPPGMFDRLYYWYPGFYTSGLSWWLRPMNKYGSQSFWVKSNGNYYYIRN
jgi:hypothetical protein